MTSTLELIRKGGHDDEVNAMVWCHTHNLLLLEIGYDCSERPIVLFNHSDGQQGEQRNGFPNYTHSIDAQADLLPDGWHYSVSQWDDGWDTTLIMGWSEDGMQTTIYNSERHKTEAAARLDAIVQVLEGEK